MHGKCVHGFFDLSKYDHNSNLTCNVILDVLLNAKYKMLDYSRFVYQRTSDVKFVILI